MNSYFSCKRAMILSIFADILPVWKISQDLYLIRRKFPILGWSSAPCVVFCDEVVQ